MLPNADRRHYHHRYLFLYLPARWPLNPRAAAGSRHFVALELAVLSRVSPPEPTRFRCVSGGGRWRAVCGWCAGELWREEAVPRWGSEWARFACHAAGQRLTDGALTRYGDDSASWMEFEWNVNSDCMWAGWSWSVSVSWVIDRRRIWRAYLVFSGTSHVQSNTFSRRYKWGCV